MDVSLLFLFSLPSLLSKNEEMGMDPVPAIEPPWVGPAPGPTLQSTDLEPELKLQDG